MLSGMRPNLAATALALALAGPAMAQSTLILPGPGGAYLIVPPAGPTSQVLTQPGGGALVVTPGRSSAIALSDDPSGRLEPVPFSAADPAARSCWIIAANKLQHM